MPNNKVDSAKNEPSSSSTAPKTSIIVQLENDSVSSLFDDGNGIEQDEEVEDYFMQRNDHSIHEQSPVKALSEHDYFEDYDNDEPAQIGASESIGQGISDDEQSYEYYSAKSNAEQFQQKVKRNRTSKESEMSEGASRIINMAFERAVQQAIAKRAVYPSTYRGRRSRGDDPMGVSKEELKQRLDETARELRPLMTTGMISHNDTHGLTHSKLLWSQLSSDKKLLANLFWEARQQATTSQPGPAYARYTLVAFFAALEGLTYPQAAFRCSISYTTAIEYIALCEVRHYFGEHVAKEIHEFTMQQIDVDDPNCMRAWSNNCAKFLNDHRRQREAKKNADLARSSDNRLYIHLKGDKRPFRVQKLQNFFLRQNDSERLASLDESRPSIVPVDGTAQPAPKKCRRLPKKPRVSLLDYAEGDEFLDCGTTAESQTLKKKRKKLPKACVIEVKDYSSIDWDKLSLPTLQPPVPWVASKDPFFIKSVTDMIQTPEDLKNASGLLMSLSRKLSVGGWKANSLTDTMEILMQIEQDEDNDC